MKLRKQKSHTKNESDSLLADAKRASRARDLAAIRSGERSAGYMHLFGRDLIKEVKVHFREDREF